MIFLVFPAPLGFAWSKAAGSPAPAAGEVGFVNIFSGNLDIDVVAGNVAAVVCLGIFGGFVREINRKDCNAKRMLAGMATSAFVSIFMAMLVAELPLNPTFQAAAIIGSGYAGRPLLERINKAIQKRIEHHVGMAGEDEKKGGPK